MSQLTRKLTRWRNQFSSVHMALERALLTAVEPSSHTIPNFSSKHADHGDTQEATKPPVALEAKKMPLPPYKSTEVDKCTPTQEGIMPPPSHPAITGVKNISMLPPPPRRKIEAVDTCTVTGEGAMPPLPPRQLMTQATNMSIIMPPPSHDHSSGETAASHSTKIILSIPPQPMCGLRPLPSLKGRNAKAPSWETSGWKRVPSKSKPNSFSYLHVKTGLRQKQWVSMVCMFMDDAVITVHIIHVTLCSHVFNIVDWIKLVTQQTCIYTDTDLWRFLFFALLCFFCFVLFCFVLFCFVLFCFVLFCFVLFCFVLFCFVLFCFVLFCFVLFCFVLFCFVLFCFALLCFALLCFALFCFVLFCFVLFCFVLFCFVLFCFVLFCFVLFCFVLFVLFCFCFVLFCFVYQQRPHCGAVSTRSERIQKFIKTETPKRETSAPTQTIKKLALVLTEEEKNEKEKITQLMTANIFEYWLHEYMLKQTVTFWPLFEQVKEY